MEYRRFTNTIVARIDKGEEILTKLTEICKKESIKLGNVNALGAVNKFKVGLFDTEKKEYFSTEHTGDHEIVSLTGSITTKEGETYLHLHMSASNKEGTTVGGHLNEAIVGATCEMFIQVIERIVEREFNDEIGLNLLKF